jgi:NADH-quinone oxidoreductase subunit L
MLLPLVLLAIGSIVSGYALFPAAHEAAAHARVRLPEVLQPVFRLPAEHLATPAWLPASAIGAAILGLLIAWYLYLSMPELRASLAAPLRPLLRLFAAKYYFDDVYDAFVRRVVVGGSDRLLWKRVDAGWIDGAVNRAGSFTAACAQALRPVQTGFVRHYVLLILAGAVALVSYLLAGGRPWS